MPGCTQERPPPLVLTGRRLRRNRTAFDEGARFALLAEAKILEEQDHVDGEGIVELHDVDVRGVSLAWGRRADLIVPRR